MEKRAFKSYLKYLDHYLDDIPAFLYHISNEETILSASKEIKNNLFEFSEKKGIIYLERLLLELPNNKIDLDSKFENISKYLLKYKISFDELINGYPDGNKLFDTLNTERFTFRQKHEPDFDKELEFVQRSFYDYFKSLAIVKMKDFINNELNKLTAKPEQRVAETFNIINPIETKEFDSLPYFKPEQLEIQEVVIQEVPTDNKIKPGLTLDQIALFNIYNGFIITKDNAKSFLTNFEQKSGDKLYGHYCHLSIKCNRIGRDKSTTKISVYKRIQKFKGTSDYLNEIGKIALNKDLEVLEKSYKKLNNKKNSNQ
jgi:hypothetical protein